MRRPEVVELLLSNLQRCPKRRVLRLRPLGRLDTSPPEQKLHACRIPASLLHQYHSRVQNVLVRRIKLLKLLDNRP
jgi:hypothetical protein